MKKYILLCLLLVATLSAVAEISVCGVSPDENGHFDCPHITSGSVTWDGSSHTLTLDNAIVEYITDNINDYIYPVRVTEDEATIVIHGECKLITNGNVALDFYSNNSKKVTILGDGSLYTSSARVGVRISKTQLTIKDIYLVTKGHISLGGVGAGLTFDNVQAIIKGHVEEIGLGINFLNCAITYPADAYVVERGGSGYAICWCNNDFPDHITISRGHLMGDVNNDSEVNIIDVDTVIKEILGNCSDTSADVNADGEINILDVDAIISIILGGDSTQDDHEYVDLGLPSGTLWATCNVGASFPEDYGAYFAWGETEPKLVYNWSTYKWCEGSENTLTKYCCESQYGYNGFVDNKTVLEPEDDAAYVNWGPSWRIPNSSQHIELRDKCSWLWTTRNGVSGCLVTGPNGNSIFLPAASLFGFSDVMGAYWSCQLPFYDQGAYAVNLNFDESVVHLCTWYRRLGHSVRAVRVAQN